MAQIYTVAQLKEILSTSRGEKSIVILVPIPGVADGAKEYILQGVHNRKGGPVCLIAKEKG